MMVITSNQKKRRCSLFSFIFPVLVEIQSSSMARKATSLCSHALGLWVRVGGTGIVTARSEGPISERTPGIVRKPENSKSRN